MNLKEIAVKYEKVKHFNLGELNYICSKCNNQVDELLFFDFIASNRERHQCKNCLPGPEDIEKYISYLLLKNETWNT